LIPKFSKKFYNYFREEYRSFKSWGKTNAELFSKDRKLIIESMPSLKKTEKSILLGASLALELLTHFKIFSNDLNSGLAFLGDKEWIEINERYFLSTDGVKNLLGTDKYVQKVLGVVNKDIRSKHQLKCQESHVVERPNFLGEIRKHFSAYTREGNDFIQFSSQKMKIIFKKVVLKN